MKKIKNLNMSLCKNRHEIPEAVDGSIFGEVITHVTSPELLEEQAFSAIWTACFRKQKVGEYGYLTQDDSCDTDEFKISSNVHLNLYVTGLTVALVAVLNAMRKEHVTVTLYHYDRETNLYFPQEVY